MIAVELAQAYPEFRVLVFDPDWRFGARCRDRGPAQFYVEMTWRKFRREVAEEQARQFCDGCAVRGSCLADALSRPGERGIWGGQTEDEREATQRKLRRVRVRLRSAADACYHESLEAV
jgi:WhiB family redox-sensing transcriptional regulator